MTKDYYLEISDESEKLTLPSEIERKKRVIKKEAKKEFKQLKWITYILLFTVLYLAYEPLSNLFFTLIKANPTIYSYYLFLEYQISNVTLLGIFFVNILGTLFFLILPSEALFIYYLSNTNYFIAILILFSVAGNIVGMTINYLFGRLLGERVLKWWFKEKKFFEYKEKIDKYGGILLVLGNIIPGPIEILSVFFGGFKFKLSKYIYLVMIGRTIKYLLIFAAFMLFWDQILVYYTSSMEILGFER